MSDTLRGVIVFVTALVTITLWVPLRNHPERLPDGVVASETYFGVFTYLTLRTELKEPNYTMAWKPSYPRLAVTAIATLALWGTVMTIVRRKRKGESDGEIAAPS